MSLNCLTCQVLQRTDSNNDRDHCGKEKDSRKFCFKERVGRSWSGISPEAFEQISRSDEPTSVVASKKGHRRLKTIATTYGAVAFEADADGEPRLARSSGMRRDWSFKNLRGEVQISSGIPSTQ